MDYVTTTRTWRLIKLIPTLRNRESYILNYRNLKKYLSMDMELHKVHRKISIGVKKIIDLNTEFLAKAKTVVT
jgi:hypothetical protein